MHMYMYIRWNYHVHVHEVELSCTCTCTIGGIIMPLCPNKIAFDWINCLISYKNNTTK